MRRVGLIAGNGRFPLIFARTAMAAGVDVVAVAHDGESPEELRDLLPATTWVKVGELDRIIRTLREGRVDCAVMAGGIRKETLLEHFAPDERAQRVLQRLTDFGDDAILRAVAGEIEREGIPVVESTLFLTSLLTPVGPLTRATPNESQWDDIRKGVAVAKALGQFDIGQSVVVRAGIVLAVEAVEGTDATIRRGARPGAVVVKVSKPQQDLRFDVPAVGADTPDVCAERGVAVLALEAGKTLLLDKEELLRKADQIGLVVIGVEPEAIT
jgi:DUF1009 family protein